MPRKRDVRAETLHQAVLDGFRGFGADRVADWTAAVGFEWEPLLAAIAAADAGLMIRSSDHGRALSVGLFCGGAPVWVTVRETTELQEVLTQAQETLETIVGRGVAPMPTRKARAARKPL